MYNVDIVSLSGNTLFSCKIGDKKFKTADPSVRRGEAVKRALSAGIDLSGAVLSYVNLRDANLRGVNLSGASLVGAKLSGADLALANLSDTDLLHASLCNSTLTQADLSRANLRHATLDGADMSQAVLVGAKLGGASLYGTGVMGVREIILAGEPNGFQAFGWLSGSTICVQVGCRDYDLEYGRKYWAGKPNRTEVLAALDYIEKVARLRKWLPRRRKGK